MDQMWMNDCKIIQKIYAKKKDDLKLNLNCVLSCLKW